MKKVFSIFGFAALLLLSFAFVPAEKADVVDCSGRIYSCAATTTNLAVITYDIIDSGGTSVFTGNVMSCGQDLVNLEQGTYSIEVTTSHRAWVVLNGEFCNGLVSFNNGNGQTVDPVNNPTVVIASIIIP